MGFWPFGATRKNRKRTNTESDHTTSLLEKPNGDPMARHHDSTQQQSPGSNKQQPAHGSHEAARKLSKARPPHQAYASSATGSLVARGTPTTPRRSSYLNQNMSQSSIGPEHFTAIPTLHATRPNLDPAVSRKKSSKRKAEDHAREKELRAMSAPIPVPKPKRPATYSGSGPLQRETQRVPGTLRRPSSQVSLPMPENISELEESLYQNSFKVGIFAALSPRPTIKYQGRSRSSLGKQPARLEPVAQSAEEDFDEDLSTSRRRIDDLADDLDSAGLRELMDRDRKRREKKKETDKQKLQRKLQRRVEKQHEEDTRRARTEEFARSSQAELHNQSSRGEDERNSTPEDTTAPPTDPFADPELAQPTRTREIRNPFADETDLDVMQDQADVDDPGEQPVSVPSPTRKIAAIHQLSAPQALEAAVSPPVSPIRSPVDDRNLSQASFKKETLSPEAAAGLERVRKSSDQSGQQTSSWTSFFRRGSRRKDSVPDRGRVTPSEFSNTSRESFARKPPPQLITSQRTFRQTNSATPQRTMSKFREDLPEYPTPPDSRMQSPEATSSQPMNIRSPIARQLGHSRSGTLDEASSGAAALERGRPDSRVHSLMSGDSEIAGHALSQSLASVDSEGSWLSGKPVNRLSGPMSPRHLDFGQKPDEMEEAIASDEYLSRLSPEPEERRQSAISGRRPSSTAFDLQKAQATVPPVPVISQTTDQGETWHGSVGRQPTVIKPANRAKSREGLLKDFQAAETGNISDEENESPKSDEEMTIMRARSVDYGNKGHARKISAGSAKVLDLRRASVQSINTPPRSPAMRSANALAGQPEAE